MDAVSSNEFRGPTNGPVIEIDCNSAVPVSSQEDK